MSTDTDTTQVQTDVETAADRIDRLNEDKSLANAVNAGQGVLAVEKDFAPLIPVVVKETKAGYKTTEFWLAIVASIVTAVGAVPTPHNTKGYIVAGIVAAYAVARGIAKAGVPDVPTDPAADAPSVPE